MRGGHRAIGLCGTLGLRVLRSVDVCRCVRVCRQLGVRIWRCKSVCCSFNLRRQRLELSLAQHADPGRGVGRQALQIRPAPLGQEPTRMNEYKFVSLEAPPPPEPGFFDKLKASFKMPFMT